MTRTALLAGLVAVVAMPAIASQTQLENRAGVEHGLYSTNQLVQLIELQREGGNLHAIARILDSPETATLRSRLSTTDFVPAAN